MPQPNNALSQQHKGRLQLLFMPIALANFEAIELLLLPLVYDISGSLIGSTKSRIDLKHF
jgi:hypothetical protein